MSEYRRALSRDGTLVMVGSSGSASSHPYMRGLGRWFSALVLSVLGRQKLHGMLARRSQNDLVAVKDLVEAEKLTPVVSAYYPLSEAPEAIRHADEGHTRGKVVITI